MFSATEESKEADAFGNFLTERREVVQVRNKKCAVPDGPWTLNSAVWPLTSDSVKKKRNDRDWMKVRELRNLPVVPPCDTDYHLEHRRVKIPPSVTFRYEIWTSCLTRWPVTLWPCDPAPATKLIGCSSASLPPYRDKLIFLYQKRLYSAFLMFFILSTFVCEALTLTTIC